MYEPHLALRVGDEVPLLFYSTISSTAFYHLKPGGCLYVECNDRFTVEVAQLLNAEGWKEVEILVDMQGKKRHVRAVKP